MGVLRCSGFDCLGLVIGVVELGVGFHFKLLCFDGGFWGVALGCVTGLEIYVGELGVFGVVYVLVWGGFDFCSLALGDCWIV